jgi:hypothetical protein
MREQGISKHRERETAEHGCLHCGHQLAGLRAERREAEDAVALFLDAANRESFCLSTDWAIADTFTSPVSGR